VREAWEEEGILSPVSVGHKEIGVGQLFKCNEK
jgi:hypothetical protein